MDIKDELKEKGMVPEASCSDVLMAAMEDIGDREEESPLRVLVIILRNEPNGQFFERFSNCHTEYEESGILASLHHRQLTNWDDLRIGGKD